VKKKRSPFLSALDGKIGIQVLVPYTTSANFGSPRGSVKSLKSLIPLRCHGSVLA